MRRVRLRPNLQIVDEGESNVFIVGDKIYSFVFSEKKYLQALYQIQNGVDEKELLSYLADAQLKLLLEKLEGYDLIIKDYENNFFNTPYEKHIDFFAEHIDNPNSFQEQLFDKSVIIIGIGGIGTVLIQHLFALGIKKFILMDFDVIHSSNLNRQFLYEYSDIGKDKLSVAKEWIKNRSSDVEVITLNHYILDSKSLIKLLSDYSKADFIACCADSPPIRIRKVIVEASLKLDIPCSFCGVGCVQGSFGPLLVEKEKKREYLRVLDKTIETLGMGTGRPINMSIGYSNTIIGAYFVMDMVNFFLKINVLSLNKKIVFSFPSLSHKVWEEY